MPKVADRYFALDPWKIVEEGFDSSRALVSESVFSLGNEYMGTRGYFEEGYSGESLVGSYFNGVYEEEACEGPSYKGFVRKTHFMVNAADWLYARIALGGEQLDLGSSRIAGFRRELDLRRGTLSREFEWQPEGGGSIRVSFLRFLDMEEPRRGFQRISFIPSGRTGPLSVKLGCDFGILHASKGKSFWRRRMSGFDDSRAALLASTSTTGISLFSGFSWGSNREAPSARIEGDRLAGYAIDLPLVEGEESFVERKTLNLVEKNACAPIDSLWERGMEGLSVLDSLPFGEAREAQARYWAGFWEFADIRIDGDESDQQGIRYCIFQMQQTYHGQDPADNIGAKGLTGEAYNGHAFWDTETYCLPFYLFSNPGAARSLLEFRYMTLDRAKERAAALDCRGACYPVATLNGEEGCSLWQHASLQFQASTAVAYGVAHYSRVTGDLDFLYGHGARLLLEISRFLLSRGSWGRGGKGFGFYAVMGPDEFHMMVSNDCYTNLMAKKTFESTLKTLCDMKRDRPAAYEALVAEEDFSDAEFEEFERCAKAMIVDYDESTRLFEQHEGYFGLPHIEVNEIPTGDFPLYNHWSYDRIYRTDMIKQPDVLMFLFLYGGEVPLETKRANYEFYEPRTIHESSLSPSIHSILASELGKREDAARFFGFATRMDLDNYNRNTGEGLHTTSIAAAWMNIVYGFGGMRSDGELLAFSPSLPSRWKGYEFGVLYRGARIRVAVGPRELRIGLDRGGERSVEVEVYGRRLSLDSGVIEMPLPPERRG